MLMYLDVIMSHVPHAPVLASTTSALSTLDSSLVSSPLPPSAPFIPISQGVAAKYVRAPVKKQEEYEEDEEFEEFDEDD